MTIESSIPSKIYAPLHLPFPVRVGLFVPVPLFPYCDRSFIITPVVSPRATLLSKFIINLSPLSYMLIGFVCRFQINCQSPIQVSVICICPVIEFPEIHALFTGFTPVKISVGAVLSTFNILPVLTLLPNISIAVPV
jgi:hypothetical protein